MAAASPPRHAGSSATVVSAREIATETIRFGAPPASCRIFITNLPLEWSTDDVLEAIADCGPVHWIKHTAVRHRVDDSDEPVVALERPQAANGDGKRRRVAGGRRGPERERGYSYALLVMYTAHTTRRVWHKLHGAKVEGGTVVVKSSKATTEAPLAARHCIDLANWLWGHSGWSSRVLKVNTQSRPLGSGDRPHSYDATSSVTVAVVVHHDASATVEVEGNATVCCRPEPTRGQAMGSAQKQAANQALTAAFGKLRVDVIGGGRKNGGSVRVFIDEPEVPGGLGGPVPLGSSNGDFYSYGFSDTAAMPELKPPTHVFTEHPDAEDEAEAAAADAPPGAGQRRSTFEY